MSNSSAGTSSSTLDPESRSRRRHAAWRRSRLGLILGLLGIAVADGPATAQPEVPAASCAVIMAPDPAAEYVGAVSHSSASVLIGLTLVDITTWS